MVTYAQTDATTIDATKLNNAFEEEAANARSAWDAKYMHLWRVNLRAEGLGTSSRPGHVTRKFYAPDDMWLVGFTVDGVTNAASVTATLSGDTEIINGDDISTSGTLTASYAPVTRTSYDGKTDPKFFIRRGALYTIKVTVNSGSSVKLFVSAVFAVQKRPH